MAEGGPALLSCLHPLRAGPGGWLDDVSHKFIIVNALSWSGGYLGVYFLQGLKFDSFLS